MTSRATILIIMRDYFNLLKKKLLQPIGSPRQTIRLTCTVRPEILKALLAGRFKEEEAFDPADPFSVLDRFAEIWKQHDDHDNGNAEEFDFSCKSLIGQMTPDNPLVPLIKPFSFFEQVMRRCKEMSAKLRKGGTSDKVGLQNTPHQRRPLYDFAEKS